MMTSKLEYDGRLEKVRERMISQGLSALLVFDPANLYYLTGYNAWSFYTPQLLFVPIEGDLVFAAREMDARGTFRTAWLTQESVIGYPENYVHRPDRHPFEWVGARLRDRGLVRPGSRVGLELDAHFFSPRAYLSLVSTLPEWEFIDSLDLVNWVRVVKSPGEIDLMRAAGAVVTGAMQTAIGNAKVGVRQCDVAAQISHSQYAGTPEFGGDYPAIVPMMPTGVDANIPHLTWTKRELADDEAVVIEIAGVHQRYHTPLARTIILGRPPAKLQSLAGAAGEGMEAVLESVRTDIPACDLARAWNREIAKYGLEKASRIGYSIGIGYPPDWGERTVSLRVEDETVLQENMTFHIICGMWMDDYGYEVSEPIRVTADGVELFANVPRGLIGKEVYS
ncbi:M24 family metallopeptidase [Ferrimicrobium sp.]|uniref:M24 family metallopeptidase n=1 Tax=Ferrimicrobium sp. TaxID=2926050 RepID=UPI002632D2F8|nr:M24 family metallopeptidase [Ferrimicrobium sp.]